MISSLSNQQIKTIIQLQKKSKTRLERKEFVIEGIKMFEESLEYGFVVKAYVMESFYKDNLLNKEYFKEVPFEIVTDSVFKEISETLTPQGILAIVNMPSYTLEDMLSKANASLLLLEDIRDPGNLGTIIRTGEGAGFSGIVLSKSSVDIYNPKVIRSTMGAIYRMPFIYVEDFLATIEKLKKNQISVYAAHLLGEHYYDEINYKAKCSILIGNEANGLTKESAALADEYVKIPMEGRVESLNAAVAASILMYEVYRQRRK